MSKNINLLLQKKTRNLLRALRQNGNSIHWDTNGIWFTTRCLYHTEQTPSLRFNIHGGQFYCHGCHQKGNYFTSSIQQLRRLQLHSNRVERTRRKRERDIEQRQRETLSVLGCSEDAEIPF